MSREIISTVDAPQPDAPISQAVRIDNLVFVSGITPFALDLTLVERDFDAQMTQAMQNMTAVLEAAGSSIAAVVKCTVILARREDWPAMNRIYSTYWPSGEFPARTAFEAKLPHPLFLVEIECVAAIDTGG